MNLANHLKQFKEILSNSTKTYVLDTELIFCHVLNKDRGWLIAHDDYILSADEITHIKKLVARRNKDEPLAYIFGVKEFYGREFIVNKNVLVPRPETEDMVELAHELIAQSIESGALSIEKSDTNAENQEPRTKNYSLRTKIQDLRSIIDVGTGSGAIAISIKLAHPELVITATDNSKPALEVAARNALKHSASVKLVEQDLLSNDKNHYDIILANMPYVPTNIEADKSITHEPPVALFSGTDGLDHYRRLFDQLKHRIPSYVLTESLISQHKDLEKIAKIAGYKIDQTRGLIQVFIKTLY